MDELDKILIENRSDFDEEPKEGHFDRFGEKLRLSEIKRKKVESLTIPESCGSTCNYTVIS